MQQLIRFDECLLADHNATVHIQRTNVFGALGRRFGPLDFDAFPPMASAIDVGIIQPVENLTSVLSQGCTTGNCTFSSLNGETFSTLAITHSSENVTSQVQTHTLRGNETLTFDLWDVKAESITAMNGTEVGNYILAFPLGEDDVPLAFALRPWPGILRTGVPTNFYEDPTVKMIIRPNFTEEAFEEYTAVSCSLHPAVNTYSARIWNGLLTEDLVRSIPFRPHLVSQDIPRFNNVLRIGTASTIQDGSQIMCEPRESPAPGYEPIAQGNIVTTAGQIVTTAGQIVEFGAVNDTRVWYVPQDCVWQYQLESLIGFHAYLSQIFDGQWLGSTIKYFKGSIHLRQLYQDGNITMDTVDEVFGNIARSMTNVIRTYGVTNYTGVPDAGPARGTMWFTSTCVHAQWSWIAFPAVMIGMAGIFLVLVHIESRGTETERLWKSSVLALLFCEMDSVVVGKAHPIHKSTLNEVAKSTRVSFGKGREVLKLVVR
jgi:hypothetical protein